MRESAAGGGDPGPVPSRPAPEAASADEPPLDLIDAAADAAARQEVEAEPANPLPEASRAAAPSIAVAAERVPANTRALLAELFKAEIGGVKRIPRDQLI